MFEADAHGPNRAALLESLQLAECSKAQLCSIQPPDAAAALETLRQSADHLRRAGELSERESANSAAEYARRAMTAVFFDLALDRVGGRRECVVLVTPQMKLPQYETAHDELSAGVHAIQGTYPKPPR